MEKKMDNDMESGIPLLVGWLVVLILISQLDNMLTLFCEVDRDHSSSIHACIEAL